MKIINMRAENIKRLTAVEISPDGSTVVIGGRNGQGKTSILDSIEYALGGTRTVCERPIHDGKKEALVVIETEDLTITRAFKGSGSTLTVRAKDGEKIKSPQSLLDRLTSKLTFDPLAFRSLDKKSQKDLLLELLGIDFSEMETKRKKIFDLRTDSNRKLSEISRQIVLLSPSDLPDKEVSLDDIELEHSKALDYNARIKELESVSCSLRSELEITIEKKSCHENKISSLESEIQIHNEKIERLDEDLLQCKTDLEISDAMIEESEYVDTSIISARFSEISSLNEKIRLNINNKRLIDELGKEEIRSLGFSESIGLIDQAKKELIEDAKMPVDGLSFDEGVNFKGVPFLQCSGAEQLRVSVAMGVAMNPELRVFLIRDGSLMDEESLKLISVLADEYDCQIWIERVGKGDECQVIIEDGQIEDRSEKE